MENVKLIGASLALSTALLVNMYLEYNSVEKKISNLHAAILRQETSLNKVSKQNAKIIKLIRNDLNSF
ncbi:MAG: hypothetical protein M1385_00500 [Candidatus Marsarchaeota archaeon]|jgi:hypothetical protein|nr:hypothetical protein [Candidatus Marsarchaeota archaeon]